MGECIGTNFTGIVVALGISKICSAVFPQLLVERSAHQHKLLPLQQVKGVLQQVNNPEIHKHRWHESPGPAITNFPQTKN